MIIEFLRTVIIMLNFKIDRTIRTIFIIYLSDVEISIRMLGEETLMIQKNTYIFSNNEKTSF